MPFEKAFVSWTYDGPADIAVGTGATGWERLLAWGTAFAAAFAFAPLWSSGLLPWNGWQALLGALIAMDVVGGVVANATNSCKRFYHAPELAVDPPAARFLKRGLTFDLLHVHPMLAAWLLPAGDLRAGVIWYVAAITAVTAVRTVPLYLRRPVALLLITLAFLVHGYVLPLGPALEWIVPLLFLKLVYGHAVREEPYRPLPPDAA